MKIQYQEIEFRKKSLQVIRQANSIIIKEFGECEE
jgi:hypothetical protein